MHARLTRYRLKRGQAATFDALEKTREWIFANASGFVEGVSRMVMGEVALLVSESAGSASQGA